MAHAHLARYLLGNPFRPVAANPRWLSPTVLALAEGVSAECAFDRQSNLADVLEEAACDHLASSGTVEGESNTFPAAG